MKLSQLSWSSFRLLLLTVYSLFRCGGCGFGFALTARNHGIRGVFGIFHRLKISNEARTRRAPSQPFPRQRAGSWHVTTYEMREPAKVLARFLRRLGDNRHLQASADYLGYLF